MTSVRMGMVNIRRKAVKTIAFLYLLFLPIHIEAQRGYSLSDCIRIAVTENAKVKQSQTKEEVAAAAVHGSRQSYIPSLSISNQNNLSIGRVLDPTTYQFLTNRTVHDMSAAVGGSMTLFSGFERPQALKKAKMNLQSALLETERTKNDLALNVTALFLNIVLDKEAVAICESKIKMLEDQETVISKKVEYKAATSADLLNVQADIANAKVDLASARNSLDLDKISLCEVLQIADWENFDVTTADVDHTETCSRMWSSNEVVASAFQLPQIKQQELAVDIAKRDIKIASSAFWPSLTLSAGYGSTYSNARTKTDGGSYGFYDQLSDNRSAYVTLSFSIPILSAISVSNNVRQKKLARMMAEYDLEQTKYTLDKEVKQTIVNANTSYEKYKLLTADVEKCTEALRQTEEKYAAWAATYYDYQTAVGNLFQSQAQKLQSKYEYIFRTKIIEFYSGMMSFN